MADAKDKLIIIAVMLSLIFIGVVGLFNLGKNLTPALDTSFGGSTVNIIWTILLRIIIAPLMITLQL